MTKPAKRALSPTGPQAWVSRLGEKVYPMAQRSRRTPLKGPPDFLVATKRPVEVSRFGQPPVFGF